MNQPLNCEPAGSVRSRLRQWFSTPNGEALREAEQGRAAEILPNLFGYYIAQIGLLEHRDLLGPSRIARRFVMNLDPGEPAGGTQRAECRAAALPIASSCMDVVVLPHTLEFEEDPHQVLRESERVLIGEGHIVIFGFNPWSLWGAWRALVKWRRQPPWCGRFIRFARLKDWLSLLGFDIVEQRGFYFRPPLRGHSAILRTAFLERLGQRWWPYFGGVYVVVARKRVVTLTPVKPPWKTRRLVATGFAKPTAREQVSLSGEHTDCP